MKLSFPGIVTIEAPAAKVWQVLADDYADIGQWASAIPLSTALRDLPAPAGAPVGGRACRASIPGFATVHEQFTYFDEATMRFGYAAVAGLPGFIRHAENHWSVRALSPTTARVEIRGEIELNVLIGWLFGPLLRRQIGRTGQFTLEELKYYIEEGRPHPRKVRSQKR